MKRGSFSALFAILVISIPTVGNAAKTHELKKAKDTVYAAPVRVFDFLGTIQKVKDLPDLRSLEIYDDVYMDLGYRHEDFGGGEWVGYIGTTTRYVPLTKAQLAHMLKIAGLNRPPLPPTPPSTDLYFLGILAVLIGLFVVSKRIIITADNTVTKKKTTRMSTAEKRLAELTKPHVSSATR